MGFKYPDGYQDQQKQVSKYLATWLDGKAEDMPERHHYDSVITKKEKIGNQSEIIAIAEIKNRKKAAEAFPDWLLELPKVMKLRSFHIATGLPVYVVYGFGFIDNQDRAIYVHKLHPDLKNNYKIRYQPITYRNDPGYDDGMMVYFNKSQCERIL